MIPLVLPLFSEVSKAQERLAISCILKVSRLHEELAIKIGTEPVGDLDPGFFEIYYKCQDQTLTGLKDMYALYEAAAHVAKAGIPGDYVECGVWRGGSSMIVALAFLQNNVTGRKLYLYDTYEGLPAFGPDDGDGAPSPSKVVQGIATLLRGGQSGMFCASIEEARQNMHSTAYPAENVILVKGLVENTLPAQAPAQVSLLHLDSDLYGPTYHSLTHLFPRLSRGGIFVIDDYGGWKGCRKASDQYFEEQGIKPFLMRAGDSGVRVGVKE